MKYKNHRAEPYFTLMKNGVKTIEGRLNKGKYAKIKKGDEVVVFNNDETNSFNVVVTGVKKYKSFETMLKTESLEKVLPNIKDVSEGIKIYRKFYSEKKKESWVL